MIDFFLQISSRDTEKINGEKIKAFIVNTGFVKMLFTLQVKRDIDFLSFLFN